MKKRMSKKVSVLIATILIISSLGSVAFAASQYKNLKAWFYGIQIFKNGQQVSLNLPDGMMEPFIVDGYTYVPLRAISDIFDKDIGWDGANYRIDINDKPGQGSSQDINYLMGLLTDKQTEINELKAKIEVLESQIEAQKVSLSDLEKDLNKEYDEYEDIEFDIDLKGDEDEIEVRIYVELDDYYDEWYDLKESEIEDYIEDIVDDIEKEFKNADIEGFIEDTDEDEILVEFEINSKGKLVFDFDGRSSIDDLDDLEEFLNDEHDKYVGVDFAISLSGDEDEIEVEIDAEDWYELYDDEKEDYLEAIYDDIIDVFPDADVYGDVYDKETGDIIDFDFDRRGNVEIDD